MSATVSTPAGVSVFNYPAWTARYPEFTGMSPDLAYAYFNEACLLYLDNTPGSIVSDVNRRLLLLNMIVAHLAKLGALDALNNPVSDLVGRISSASEGSVSVSVENGPATASSAWWQQTKYGSAFWNATLAFRSATYVPGPVRDLGFGVARTAGYSGAYQPQYPPLAVPPNAI